MAKAEMTEQENRIYSANSKLDLVRMVLKMEQSIFDLGKELYAKKNELEASRSRSDAAIRQLDVTNKHDAAVERRLDLIQDLIAARLFSDFGVGPVGPDVDSVSPETFEETPSSKELAAGNSKEARFLRHLYGKCNIYKALSTCGVGNAV